MSFAEAVLTTEKELIIVEIFCHLRSDELLKELGQDRENRNTTVIINVRMIR